jgi:hypothetical protein
VHDELTARQTFERGAAQERRQLLVEGAMQGLDVH